jgi:4-hydroxy-tetrahydrodipicolinate reductase
MGKSAVQTFIDNDQEFELVAGVVRDLGNVEDHVKEELLAMGVQLTDNLRDTLQRKQVDVLVELTTAESVYHNSRLALESGIKTVIGATGLSDEEIAELDKISKRHHVGCIIAPNFAIGAILMMQFSQKASKYFGKCEIVEFHHDRKIDAPSGTSVKTAKMIASTNRSINSSNKTNHAATKIESNIPIHSIRLPGFVAHQEVIFGGVGQTLTIRHDSIDRSSFMPGILLATRKVMQTEELIYGLEQII